MTRTYPHETQTRNEPHVTAPIVKLLFQTTSKDAPQENSLRTSSIVRKVDNLAQTNPEVHKLLTNLSVGFEKATVFPRYLYEVLEHIEFSARRNERRPPQSIPLIAEKFKFFKIEYRTGSWETDKSAFLYQFGVLPIALVIANDSGTLARFNRLISRRDTRPEDIGKFIDTLFEAAKKQNRNADNTLRVIPEEGNPFSYKPHQSIPKKLNLIDMTAAFIAKAHAPNNPTKALGVYNFTRRTADATDKHGHYNITIDKKITAVQRKDGDHSRQYERAFAWYNEVKKKKGPLMRMVMNIAEYTYLRPSANIYEALSLMNIDIQTFFYFLTATSFKNDSLQV